MQDTSTSLNPSIAPSDSISCNGSASHASRSGQSMPYSAGFRHSEPHPQPATRPSEYPEEILWSLDDCKADPNVEVSSTNSSRLPMKRAIRRLDGVMISASEWATIKATAHMVKADLLSLPPSQDRRARERTKSTFKHTLGRSGMRLWQKWSPISPCLCYVLPTGKRSTFWETLCL